MPAPRKDKYKNARSLYEQGLSVQQVGDFFGVTRQAMHDILKRRGTLFRSNLRYGKDNHFYRGGKTASDTAHNLLETAIRKNIIIRKVVCEQCGDRPTLKDGRTGIHAHHCDYNKPLDVMWLCQKCHHEWHKHNRAIERREI